MASTYSIQRWNESTPCKFDGQTISSLSGDPLYELTNYLGGGVAGVVYEANASNIDGDSDIAVKVLNPLGFKLHPSNFMRSCVVAHEGDLLEDSSHPLELRHVSWL